MNKKKLKQFAIWAHRELQKSNAQKLTEWLEKHPEDGDNGAVRQREWQKHLRLQKNDEIVEKHSYQWFIRIVALRFMDVNGYLSLKHPLFRTLLHHDINKWNELDIAGGSSLNRDDMILKICRSLHNRYPNIFLIDDISDYFFPDHAWEKDGFIEKFIHTISDDEFLVQGKGQVEIIGWLYQYYFSEAHDNAVDPLHGGAIEKDDIPLVTQIFTPEWIVHYIVDNTLGRFWVEHNPDDDIVSEFKYLVRENIHTSEEKISPEEITVFEPCIGAGHFLTYAFDILMKIYISKGYKAEEAVRCILTKNLYGVDIDARMIHMAQFALAMKAIQYDSNYKPEQSSFHLHVIDESDNIDIKKFYRIFQCEPTLKKNIMQLMRDMHHAKAFGSLLPADKIDIRELTNFIENHRNDNNTQIQSFIETFEPFRTQLDMLSRRYDIVITNPPYLNKYDPTLKSFIQKYYTDYSGNLFSAFIYRCFQFCNPQGYVGLMTPNVWMFIKNYTKLRQYILSYHQMITLIQMAKGAFFEDATVDICAFVMQTFQKDDTGAGIYFRLESFSGDMDIQKQKYLEALSEPSCRYVYRANEDIFQRMPCAIFGYWIHPLLLQAFTKGVPLYTLTPPHQGLATTDNAQFLRYWFEVDKRCIGFNQSRTSAKKSGKKWFPYNKGGRYRRWYGNQDYVINYMHDGKDIKQSVMEKYPYLRTPDFVVKNQDTYFQESLSWSKVSSGKISFRFYPKGFLYDVSGCSLFGKEALEIYAGFLNSSVCQKLLEILSPTVNYEAGQIAALPIIIPEHDEAEIRRCVSQNTALAKIDWDSEETSWAFKKHPLICKNAPLSKAYQRWANACEKRYCTVQKNEETLNRIFIQAYHLESILSAESREPTMRKPDLEYDVKTLISYAVGCIFGRFHPTVNGVIFGENQALSQKERYGVSEPIVSITDDGQCKNDIVSLFVQFISDTFGEAYLDHNLEWIAKALGDKNMTSPVEVIRDYFRYRFYKDHIVMYKYRPIYWLINAGRYSGFQCLIYIHRYEQSILMKIEKEYIQPRKERYIRALEKSKHECCRENAEEKTKASLKVQLKLLNRCMDKLRFYDGQHIELDCDDGVLYNHARFGNLFDDIRK